MSKQFSYISIRHLMHPILLLRHSSVSLSGFLLKLDLSSNTKKLFNCLITDLNLILWSAKSCARNNDTASCRAIPMYSYSAVPGVFLLINLNYHFWMLHVLMIIIFTTYNADRKTKSQGIFEIFFIEENISKSDSFCSAK